MWLTHWTNLSSLLDHFNHSALHGIFCVSLEAFSRFLERQVSVQQFLVAVFPLDAVPLLELLFVLIHESHEVYSKIESKMELTGNVIRNGTEVGKNGDHIRLLIVVRSIKVMVTNQIIPVLYMWPNVRKVLDVLRVAHKCIPRGTLNRRLRPLSFF